MDNDPMVMCLIIVCPLVILCARMLLAIMLLEAICMISRHLVIMHQLIDGESSERLPHTHMPVGTALHLRCAAFHLR